MIWAILGILGSFIEGISVSIDKKTLLKEHAMEFSASLVLVSMLLSTPFWLFSQPDTISLEAFWFTAASGLFFALSVFFFAKALRHMATPYTNPFLSLVPISVTLFSIWILGEVVSLIQWTAIIIISVGIYALYAHHHKNILEPIKKAVLIPHLKYVFLGIIAYAVSSVLDKKLVSPEHLHLGFASYFSLLLFFAGVVLIVMMLMFHDGFSGIGNGMRGNTRNLFILGLLLLISKGILVYAFTFPGILASTLYSIKEVGLIFSMAISGDLLHKDHLLRKIGASLIIIAGAAILLMI